MAKKTNGSPQLAQSLSLFQATALVIGSVIGSGIFVSSAGMARQLPSGWQLMGVWALAGAMTILGALTQCELCSRMPVTGGLYAYLRVIFGDALAFFYGWANFMVAGSGAIAAIAFIFAGYLSEFVPIWQPPASWESWAVYIPYVGTLYPAAHLGIKLMGSALILGLTALNVRGVQLGAIVQSLSSSAKILAIIFIVLVALFFGQGDWNHFWTSKTTLTPSTGWMAIWLSAMAGAFWSYDGWGNVAFVGGEIKDAQRNLPRAILIGTSLVIGTYLLVNLAYLYVLPVEQIANAPGERVASLAVSQVWGHSGSVIVAVLILLATFDTVNSTILTNARVYYAMAQEGLFWSKAGKIHSKYASPAVSLWLQGCWSVFLLITGSFDLITNMYVFVNWLFYFSIPLGLFILRRQSKTSGVKRENFFKVPLYPWLPLAFAAFTLTYVVQTLVSDVLAYQAGREAAIKSFMGLLLVFAGTPFLWVLKTRKFRKGTT